MNEIITFIIPIRHQDNASNWDSTIANLTQTLTSISNQSVNNWKCVIVVNHGAKLPVLPNGVSVCYVDFPPNPTHTKSTKNEEDFYEAVRKDKGRRILSGLIFSQVTEYVMVVDDDDFIHADLSKFVAENRGQPGWYIENGYLWGDKGNWLLEYSNFKNFCGTSFIVQRKFLKISDSVENADIEYVKMMFGSHMNYQREFNKLGAPLKPVPFKAAVYRIGHSNSHSLSNGLFKHSFGRKNVLLNPFRFLKLLFSLRYLSASKVDKFSGIKN